MNNKTMVLALVTATVAGMLVLESVRPDQFENEAALERNRHRVMACLQESLGYWELADPEQCKPYRLHEVTL